MGAQGLLRVGRMNWLWDLKIWIENQSRTHPGFVRPWNGNRIFCSFETGNKLNVCWLLQRLGQQSMLSFHSSHQWTNPDDSNGFTQTPKMGSHHSFRYNRLHYHHPLKNDQWKRNTTIIGNWTTITKGVTHWDGTCWEQYMSYIIFNGETNICLEYDVFVHNFSNIDIYVWHWGGGRVTLGFP